MTIAMIALAASTALVMQIMSCFVIVSAYASAGSRCSMSPKIQLVIALIIVRYPSEDHGRRGSIDAVDVRFEVEPLRVGCDFHMREFSFLLVSGVIGRCVLDQIHEVTQTKT